jgi:CRP-like cAMP-binding protein
MRRLGTVAVRCSLALTRQEDEGGRTMSAFGKPRNKLLCEMPQDELEVLLQIAEKVKIRPRQVLHHWRLPMEYVYFIERGLVSVSARVNDDDFVEAWLVGSEGMVGSPLVLTDDQQFPPHRRIVQIGGEALRIPAREFQAILPELPCARRLLQRYVQMVLFQASQFGACNAVHSVKERLARWLLVASSGLDSADLPITHEVLGQLLGVRRATVTEAVEVLQREALIRTARGVIGVMDVEGLQAAACPCYGLVHREYRRQIQTAGGPEHGRIRCDATTTVLR